MLVEIALLISSNNIEYHPISSIYIYNYYYYYLSLLLLFCCTAAAAVHGGWWECVRGSIIMIVIFIVDIYTRLFFSSLRLRRFSKDGSVTRFQAWSPGSCWSSYRCNRRVAGHGASCFICCFKLVDVRTLSEHCISCMASESNHSSSWTSNRHMPFVGLKPLNYPTHVQDSSLRSLWFLICHPKL